MIRTLILGALARVLASCANPSGDMSVRDAAALSRYMGGAK